MLFTEADSGSKFEFLAVVAWVAFSILCAAWVSLKKSKMDPTPTLLKTGATLLVWLILFSSYVSSGLMETHPLPFLPLYFIASMAGAIGFTFSPIGTLISEMLSIRQLIFFQAFRFPLELILHSWVSQGTIPETMTWTGKNLDILTGIFALILAITGVQSKKVAWVFNGLGLVLLANVARVAIFSSPVAFGWGVTPPLQLVFHLPYAWIVPFCVGGALAGHLVLTRALRSL